MSTLYSIGLMNQLGDALEAEGFTPDDVTKLRSHSKLDLLLSFAKGQAEITIKTYIIDCDANPHIPDDWKIIEHQKDGQFHWNPDKVGIYLCNEQENGSIEGYELRKKLKGYPVLNANVLDYLLANPQLIPEEWKGNKSIFFWGTIYCDSSSDLHVRCLYWDSGCWNSDSLCLYNHWDDSTPTALSCK